MMMGIPCEATEDDAVAAVHIALDRARTRGGRAFQSLVPNNLPKAPSSPPDGILAGKQALKHEPVADISDSNF